MDSATPSPAYFFVITLEAPDGTAITQPGLFVPGPDASQQAIFEQARAKVVADHPSLARSVVTHWYLAPNAL
ncbi:hypothetical protein [Streptomyces bohaiensis]|uniref:Uncharacterized protein n=1 Tax=Streptomyces bohaiensis TaxID=1431344 RepID=A0ABX1C4R2_9ACTN|nr:hypothetical protein [Streptomyces bohaiensis]NJQ14205.1 hypothetical protein [Streptomyces bohaiensis]